MFLLEFLVSSLSQRNSKEDSAIPSLEELSWETAKSFSSYLQVFQNLKIAVEKHKLFGAQLVEIVSKWDDFDECGRRLHTGASHANLQITSNDYK